MVLIASAVAVRTKGLGFLFVAVMVRAIACSSSATERNTPRFRLCRMGLEKKPSTALNYEHEIGVT